MSISVHPTIDFLDDPPALTSPATAPTDSAAEDGSVAIGSLKKSFDEESRSRLAPITEVA
ncbi:MAG: hypothetical protein WA317_10525 [Mycobacterium sp.]|uniref:hypothetical protein n=1 Tax=Mycobacterium sp. TaxID=1785 RepID=UPI003CC69944